MSNLLLHHNQARNTAVIAIPTTNHHVSIVARILQGRTRTLMKDRVSQFYATTSSKRQNLRPDVSSAVVCSACHGTGM
ncbi:predicted protein [Plenodomus lingam JN3]|uniref:Predicted protein n=2 Tax=Leptosphaeria maculans TaxID=5022 RepID=E5ADW0_LEPMJ|nr:predicted protein [Plenodomus lingam JN3]CBY01399.1 predicted protein [Plenodomus lingam JN3]